MLNLKTLLNKQSFTKLNGDKVVDLVRRSVSFLGIRLNSGITYQVTDESAMRADLIANYYYQDSSNCDLLLKYNGYSNPFAIDINDVIRIPETTTLSSYGEPGSLLEIGKPRKKKATTVFQPTTKQDKRRLAFLIKKAGVGTAPIPPNIAITNGVTISNGKIIFGTDVTNIKKEDCPEPISRTKLKESLLKNKINN
jgi:hypothetical protein